MTNEELALKIQNGERDLIPPLWEQVERFIYLKSENWYWQHEETCIRCGVALDDLKQVSYFAFLDAISFLPIWFFRCGIGLTRRAKSAQRRRRKDR